MRMDFDRLAFRAGSSGKPDVDVVFGGIEFIGPLAFIETLKELIPLDGFSDPPFLDVSPSGVARGLHARSCRTSRSASSRWRTSASAPTATSRSLARSVTVGFNFCTREQPFR